VNLAETYRRDRRDRLVQGIDKSEPEDHIAHSPGNDHQPKRQQRSANPPQRTHFVDCAPDADQSDLAPSVFAGAQMALHIFGLTRLGQTGYTRTRRRPRRHSANSARGGDWRRIIFANRVAIATTSPLLSVPAIPAGVRSTASWSPHGLDSSKESSHNRYQSSCRRVTAWRQISLGPWWRTGAPADGSASGREPPRVALILTWKPVSRWPELGLDRWGLLDRLT
jgi:hypothetical protein